MDNLLSGLFGIIIGLVLGAIIKTCEINKNNEFAEKKPVKNTVGFW